MIKINSALISVFNKDGIDNLCIELHKNNINIISTGGTQKHIERLNIPVHIDSAWIGCIRDIEFNFNHPAIKTFAVSLSKAGIGNNRIGDFCITKRSNSYPV